MKHDVKPTKYLLVFILLNMIGTGANASDKAASKTTSVLQAVSISECVSLAEIKSYDHCSKKKGTDIELYLHNSCTTPIHATVCFDYPNGKVRMDEDKIRPGKKCGFLLALMVTERVTSHPPIIWDMLPITKMTSKFVSLVSAHKKLNSKCRDRANT